MSCSGGIPEYFTGDDWLFLIYLETSEGPYDASAADSIDVAVVSTNDLNAQLLVGPVSADPNASGADWDSGVVVVEFDSADTNITNYGSLWVEVQVTVAGSKITFPRGRFVAQKGIIP